MNFNGFRKALQPLVSTGKVLFSKKYLLYTNTTVSVTLSAAGDLLNQKYQIYKEEMTEVDKKRSRDVAVTGLFIGPFCHYWYQFLDRRFPGRTFKILTKKILVDQIFCSPVIIGLFLVVTSTLEKKSWEKVIEENKDKVLKLYAADWLIYPPAQYINFYCLPTQYRVIYDNVISFAFDVYFSKVKYGKHGRTEGTPEKPTENLLLNND